MVKSIAEILNTPLEDFMREDGVLDGSVVFDAKNRTLDIYENGEQAYWIDLDRATTPAEILDWLMQLHLKKWVTPELFWKIMRRLDYACLETFGQGIQGVFCPCGVPQRATWKRHEEAEGSPAEDMQQEPQSKSISKKGESDMQMFRLKVVGRHSALVRAEKMTDVAQMAEAAGLSIDNLKAIPDTLIDIPGGCVTTGRDTISLAEWCVQPPEAQGATQAEAVSQGEQ